METDRLIARLERELRAYDAFLASYETALASADPGLWRRQAQELHARGDGGRAAVLFERVVRDGKLAGDELAWTRLQLADAYRMDGRFAEAKRTASDLRRELSTTPTSPQGPGIAERVDLLLVFIAGGERDCTGAAGSTGRFRARPSAQPLSRRSASRLLRPEVRHRGPVLLNRAASRFTRSVGLAFALGLCAGVVSAQFSADATPARLEKVVLSAAADRTAYLPGEPVRIAARMEIAEGWHLQAHVPTYDYLIPTTLTVETPEGWPAAEIDYPAPTLYKFAFAEDELDVIEGRKRILAHLVVPNSAISGPVRLTCGCAIRHATTASVCRRSRPAPKSISRSVAGGVPAAAEEFAEPEATAPTPATADPGGNPAATATTTPSRGPLPVTSRSLPAILLLALLGGFILNGMPCVLPILSLKLFGLVQASGKTTRTIRIGALATTAGILASFWALAGTAVVARQAGAAIGWGVQFQQPGFVAFLTVVVLLFSLNLWGLFEIPLPARLARLGDAGVSAGSGADGHGLAGHFASGLFATLMATPCSAPFLGTALSFALGQSGGTIFAVLTAVGVGLAIPYLMLAAAPGAAKWLPRPGDWMLTLRGIMGFLLAGAVVWLIFVLGGQIDSVSLALFELGLLGLSFFLWLRQRAELERRRTGFWWLLAGATAVGVILFAGRATPAAHDLSATNGSTSGTSPSAGAVVWTRFDRAEAERLSAGGRLVFLDITADWCVTCKVNERLILNNPAVVAAFLGHDVLAMKADWTNRDDGIARFLAEHGRYGIPFYMLYRPGGAPHLFGELLSADEVARVIAESAAAR